MLKYLWTVTQDLFVTVTLVTLMHAALSRLCDKRGTRIHGAGILLGVLASAALAAVKGTTNKIVSSHWNHYIYAVTLALILLFIILCLVLRRKGGLIVAIVGAGVSAVIIFYHLPGVMLYPFNFNTMGEGYLSSYYMVRMAGFVIVFAPVILVRCPYPPCANGHIPALRRAARRRCVLFRTLLRAMGQSRQVAALAGEVHQGGLRLDRRLDDVHGEPLDVVHLGRGGAGGGGAGDRLRTEHSRHRAL